MLNKLYNIPDEGPGSIERIERYTLPSGENPPSESDARFRFLVGVVGIITLLGLENAGLGLFPFEICEGWLTASGTSGSLGTHLIDCFLPGGGSEL